MSRLKGFIFDLDGVLADTSGYHYQAWKTLSDELGLDFDSQINERLKGVGRRRSFEIILEENNALGNFTDVEIRSLLDRKNELYKELIGKITPKDVLPGILDFLTEAKANGIKLAVASASRNAFSVLDSLQITKLFDYISDASKIKNPKPSPEVFLDCMEALSLQPDECIGFEDAQAGIEAIKSAHMSAVGIGVTVTSVEPDMSLPDTRALSFQKIAAWYNARKS